MRKKNDKAMHGQFLRDMPEPQTQNRLGVGLEHLI